MEVEPWVLLEPGFNRGVHQDKAFSEADPFRDTHPPLLAVLRPATGPAGFRVMVTNGPVALSTPIPAYRGHDATLAAG